MKKHPTKDELVEGGLLSALFKTARIFEKDGFVNRAEFEKLYAKSTKSDVYECHCEKLKYRSTSSWGNYKVKVHVGILTYKCGFMIFNAPGKFKSGTLITSAHYVKRC